MFSGSSGNTNMCDYNTDMIEWYLIDFIYVCPICLNDFIYCGCSVRYGLQNIITVRIHLDE